MKGIALLIDTNVVLDWMMKREPFYQDSRGVMQFCIDEKAKGFLSSHTILNAFFIARKSLSVDERKGLLLYLCRNFIVIDINNKLLVRVLRNEAWQDIEDCLQAECAKAANVDYVITRDVKDFKFSSVPAMSPEDFLKLEG